MFDDLGGQLDLLRIVAGRASNRVAEDELEVAAVEGAHTARVGADGRQVVEVVPEVNVNGFKSQSRRSVLFSHLLPTSFFLLLLLSLP